MRFFQFELLSGFYDVCYDPYHNLSERFSDPVRKHDPINQLTVSNPMSEIYIYIRALI